MRHCCGGMSRRQFLHRAGALAGGAALVAGGAGLLGSAGRALAQAEAKVVVGHSPRLWTNEKGMDVTVVGEVLDQTLMWLTGTTSPEKAWASRFSSDETVGIKPNGLGGPELATSRALTEHCVDRLTGIGVKREKIIVWEQTPGFIANCGIPLDDIPFGVKAVLTSDTLGQRIKHGTIDDTLTDVVLRQADAILNLPILKDHAGAGVTLSMKNHYGTVSNPGGLHSNMREQIADLASIPQIKDKTRLIICDMTHCVVEGGPGGMPHFFPNAVMAATDMAAHDAVGARIIEEERKKRNMPTLESLGRPPAYLAVAQERGVGISDLARIEVKQMEIA